MNARRLLPLLLLIPLAACATTPGASPAGPTLRPPPPMPSLVGYDAKRLGELFGTPDIDVAEGNARKLQFVNETCVLDAFLYPPRQGEKPVTTFVDTRDRRGNAVDADTCLRSLRVR